MRREPLVGSPKRVGEVIISAYGNLARAEALQDCVRRHGALARGGAQLLSLPRVGGGGLRLGDVGDASPAEEDSRGAFDLVGERIRRRGNVLAVC